MVAFAISSTQNSRETISNSVWHSTFSEIILLNGAGLHLMYDLMNKFFNKAAPENERVSLLGDWEIIYLNIFKAQQVIEGNRLAVCRCFFSKKS